MNLAEADAWFKRDLVGKKGQPWTRQERAFAAALWREGRCSKVIAHVVGRNHRMVQKVLREELGVIAERHRLRNDQIAEMWIAGATRIEIGEAVGLTDEQVGGIIQQLRKRGVRLPRRRPRKASA